MAGVFLMPPESSPERAGVAFRGRSRADTKRALLKYWSANEHRLNMELDEFVSRCTLVHDAHIVFEPRRRV